MCAKFSKLRDPTRQTLPSILEHVMTEELQVAATTHRYVWSVRGSATQSLKRLLTEQGRQIDHWINELVKHARDAGMMFAFKAEEALTDDPGRTETLSGAAERAMVGKLVELHEGMAARLRTDVATMEQRSPNEAAGRMLNRLLDFHETTAWMLRLLLEQRET